jgi:hypothetical protein
LGRREKEEGEREREGRLGYRERKKNNKIIIA